jgi:hypothetical protein
VDGLAHGFLLLVVLRLRDTIRVGERHKPENDLALGALGSTGSVTPPGSAIDESSQFVFCLVYASDRDEMPAYTTSAEVGGA